MIDSLYPKNFGKVAVLFGGTNSEREVSLESGAAVCDACSKIGLNYIPIDIGKKPIEQLQKVNPDWAFNILHGGIGEDGTISCILDMLGIKYCSSDQASSAISMNKFISKQIWQANSLPVPRGIIISSESDIDSISSRNLGLPLVVKPVNEGSSLGVFIVKSIDELKSTIKNELKSYPQLLIEEYISGSEVTVSILGDRVLPTISIESSNDFYDYKAKYLEDTTMRIPSGLSDSVELLIQKISLQAFSSIGCRFWGRVDYMISDEGNPFLLEINVLPGMTSHSLVPKAAQAAGMDFDQLIANIFLLAKNGY